MTVPIHDGRLGSTALFAAIVSQLDSGVQGWAFGGVARGDIRVAEVTVDSTAAAPEPEGFFRGGFVVAGLVPDQAFCFLTAVVLSLREPVTLPARGTATVLALRVESLRPQGQEPVVGKIEIKDDSCAAPASPPIQAVVTVEGRNQPFCSLPGVTVSFVERPPQNFRRGDANSDTKLDLTDAIGILTFLFRGTEPPDCLDAADTSDDGRLDVTDGIRILEQLFQGGSPIPAPGPSACGTDPTPDPLSCAAHAGCS